MKGKYLNPKYARRKRKCQVFLAGLCIAAACVWGGTELFYIDQTIRQTKLPYTPPIAGWERDGCDFQLSFLGVTADFSVQWFFDILSVPPAPVRLVRLLACPPPG